MSKLDELRKSSVSNIDESMGGGRPVIHGVLSPGPRPVPARLQGIVRSANAAEIPVERIIRDERQPREEFQPEALERLAESLRTKGQLQPIRVRWSEEQGSYIVIAGERRWRAAQLAGLKSLACVIAETPTERGELLVIQLIENCVREDLKPIEQAKAFRALMDLNGWPGSQVAKVLGIAQPNVVRALSLLDLPITVQDQVESGELAPSIAYEVSKISDPNEQVEVADRAVTEKLSRAEVTKAVLEKSKPLKGRGSTKGKPKKLRSWSCRSSQGTKVTVELSRGLDNDLIITALTEALDRLRAQSSASEAA